MKQAIYILVLVLVIGLANAQSYEMQVNVSTPGMDTQTSISGEASQVNAQLNFWSYYTEDNSQHITEINQVSSADEEKMLNTLTEKFGYFLGIVRINSPSRYEKGFNIMLYNYAMAIYNTIYENKIRKLEYELEKQKYINREFERRVRYLEERHRIEEELTAERYADIEFMRNHKDLTVNASNLIIYIK